MSWVPINVQMERRLQILEKNSHPPSNEIRNDTRNSLLVCAHVRGECETKFQHGQNGLLLIRNRAKVVNYIALL